MEGAESVEVTAGIVAAAAADPTMPYHFVVSRESWPEKCTVRVVVVPPFAAAAVVVEGYNHSSQRL